MSQGLDGWCDVALDARTSVRVAASGSDDDAPSDRSSADAGKIDWIAGSMRII
jgi:hypothetical protein